MDKNAKNPLLPQLMLLVTAAVWGGGFLATRIAMDERLSPGAIMFGRFFVAAVVFGVVFLPRVKKAATRQSIGAGLVMGALLFCGFFTQTAGMAYTSPSRSAFLTATNVVMVPFLWWAIAKKRPPVRIVFACLACLVGIAALSLTPGEGISLGLGEGLTLLCAVFFAAHMVASGLFALRYDPRVLVLFQFVMAAGLSFLAFLALDGDFSAFLPSKGLGAVAYLGVFSTCLCYFLQGTAQQYVPPSKTAIILCTEALFGTLFSIMMGYDSLTAAIAVGGAMILGAVLLSELQLPARKKQITHTSKPGEQK